jgi:hypothetical protein
MKRLLWILLWSSLATFAVSGCVTLRVTTTIREDGSGTNQIGMAVDSSLYSMSRSEFNKTAMQVQEQGGTVEDWLDGSRRGVLITYPFRTLDEMRTQLTGSQLQGTTGGLFDVQIKQSSGLLERTYEAEIRVDTTKLSSGQDTYGMNAAMLQSMDLSYSIILPGKITSHNGQLVEENQVRWAINAAGRQVYTLKAVSSAQNTTFFMLAGGCGLLLMFALALVVAAVIMLRPRRSMTFAMPGAPSARPANRVFCAKCGTANEKGSRFCLHCGKSLVSGTMQ